MTRQYASGLLRETHDVARFDSGAPLLDEWLRREAMRAQRAGSARTFVWTQSSSPVVVAYYSIAPTTVGGDAVSRSMSGGYSVIPAYLIGKLALQRGLQSRGLGQQLLLDALDVIVSVAEQGGGRLIVVDAIDDAATAFYRRYDFQPVRDRRLVMKVATAKTALRR